jgi:3-oxoacyl-[acyl-carrier protein] reductase
MINLTGQVALITGGSRGIGAATALLFAQAGAKVAITYASDKKSADNIVHSIGLWGVKGKSYKLQIAKYGQCRKLIQTVIRDFGKIDILVNNAGIWKYGEIGRMTEKEWSRMLDINLNGIFNMCNGVVPHMKRRKYGRIINISSTAGQRGEALHSHYAASKGGTIAFTKSLGAELISDGIYVNCVAPGWVDTDMTAGTLNDRATIREITRTIPRGKVGKPEEIAGPILFLASSLSNNIVGEILNVNGGSVMCG